MAFRKLVPIFVLLFSCSANAASTWSQWGLVQSIYSHNGFHIVETTVSDNPCSISGKFYWNATDADAKDMLSLAMAAMMAGKQVRLAYDSASPNCNWNAAEVTHFNVKN